MARKSQQKQKKIRIDKYSKTEPKIPKAIIIGLASFFLVVIGLIVIFTPSNQDTIYDAYKDQPNVTADFTENHPFLQINYANGLFRRGLKSRIDKEEIVILYVGFAQCPSCQIHVGAFERYFRSESIDEFVNHIYYLNTSADLDGFESLLKSSDQIREEVPQLIVFKDGEIIHTFTPQSADDIQTINRSVRDFFRTVKTSLT